MLPIIQKAGFFHNGDCYVIKRKKYDSLLLVSTITGKCHLKYENREYPINENEGFIIDCNRPHVYFTERVIHGTLHGYTLGALKLLNKLSLY
jgi:hypothetical protein